MQKITKEEFLALDDKTVNEYLDGERFPERYTSENLKKSLRENKITVKDIFNYHTMEMMIYSTSKLKVQKFTVLMMPENLGKTNEKI